MGEVRNGIIVDPTGADFKDALDGVPISPKVKTRAAQAVNVSHLTQQYFNPFWEMSTMEIPKDRRKINAWCRYFFDSEPLVHAALTLHTEFPLSAVYIEHPDPEIKEFLDEMVDNLDLFEFMMNMALEMWTVGEAFPFGILDDPDDPQVWEKFILLDPDFVDVFSLPMARGIGTTRINMLPSPILRKTIENGPYDPNTGELYEQIPVDVIDYVRRDEPMPLDPLCASHVKILGNPFNERGTPILLSCCLPGTPIWMANGSAKPIEDMQVGDEVITHDGSSHKVLGINARPVHENVSSVLYDGFSEPLKLTSDDKLLAVRAEDIECKKRHNGEPCIPGVDYRIGNTLHHNCNHELKPEMVAVNELKPGDYLVTPKPERPQNIDTGHWTSEMAKLLGYYLAEGWIIKHNSDGPIYGVRWITTEREIIDEIKDLCVKVWGKEPTVTEGDKSRKTPVFRVNLHLAEAGRWYAEHGGQYAKAKRLSDEVMSLPDDLLTDMLGTYWNGDGTTNVNGASCTTASIQMAWQIYTIMCWLEWHPRIEKRMVTTGKSSPEKPSTVYKVKLNRGDARKIPMMERKAAKIPSKMVEGRRDAHNMFWVDNYLYHKIRSIDTFYYDGNVYPMETEGNHTYIANGITKSNCFKLLMYREKLRSAQYAIADRHVTPKEFYMIGESGDPASPDEIAAFKEALMSTWTQPNQAIVYHHALRIEWQGACHDDRTECLTKDGFKTYDQLTSDDLIATIDPATGELIYSKPDAIHIYDYDGDLYHFISKNKVDVMVTPNHRMWASKRKRNNGIRTRHGYEIMRADEITTEARFRTDIEWNGILDNDCVIIGEHTIPMDDYLELGGYYVSEGSSFIRSENSGRLTIYQNLGTDTYLRMKRLFDRLPFKTKEYQKCVSSTGNPCMQFTINNIYLVNKLRDDFGHKAKNKYIAQWVKNLPPEYIQIILDAANAGDGSNHHGSGYWTYATTSKLLADDIQELAWKCGYAPTVAAIAGDKLTGFANRSDRYTVYWTTKNDIGKRPYVKKIDLIHYTGKVWCVTVPTGLFVTRRNGKITIQGNSGRILPLQAEFDDIEKHILAGLMTSRAFLHGEGPTYATGSVALDVLIQRYMFFRRKMERWLLKSVFGPIMKIHGMYKPVQSELNGRYRIKNRERPVWLPEIQWEKQNLRDDVQRSQLMQALFDKGILPAAMLLKSSNIDPSVAMKGIEAERGTVFDKQSKVPGPGGGPPIPPGGIPDMPAGDMIQPSGGGLELPNAGFGDTDMGGLPIAPPNASKPPESSAPMNLPSAV